MLEELRGKAGIGAKKQGSLSIDYSRIEVGTDIGGQPTAALP